MDTLKDIFKSAFERFSNPFVFSFVCAWLIFNWQITLALFWFDKDQIVLAGYTSLIDLIAEKVKVDGIIWKPLLFSFGFVLVNPWIKNLISSFNTYTAKIGDKWNLNISKDGKVSVSKFISLNAELSKQKKYLAELIENENTLAHENEDLKLTLSETNSRLMGAEHDRDRYNLFIENLNRLANNFNGNFTVTKSVNLKNVEPFVQKVFIDGTRYYVYQSDRTKKLEYNIVDFYYSTFNSSVFLVMKKLIDEREPSGMPELSVLKLEKLADGNYTGYENYFFNVNYSIGIYD